MSNRRGCTRGKSEAAAGINWSEIALEGSTAHEFDEQIKGLQTLLHEGWQTRTSAKTGNPLYERPSVLVLYRADQRFVLDRTIPRPGGGRADYDLVIASQPYRARLDAAFKVDKVLAPLARALGPGGRMIVIQSTGRDPGMDIIGKVWPDENPFQTPAPELVSALHDVLADTPRLYCEPFDHDHSLFRYHPHAMPDEVRQQHRHVDPDGGLERRRLRRPDRRSRADRRAQPRPLPRRHARGPAQAQGPVVPRRVLRRLLPARLSVPGSGWSEARLNATAVRLPGATSAS